MIILEKKHYTTQPEAEFLNKIELIFLNQKRYPGFILSIYLHFYIIPVHTGLKCYYTSLL